MFRKLFVSVLVVTSSFILAIGQSPEARKEKEKAAQAFTFTFEGDDGYLGVKKAEVSKENFGKFGLREVRGVAVEKVLENSPAAAAGIKAGDVIVRFNGDDVTSTRKLTRLISDVAPNHQARIAVFRNGTEQEINVTNGKRPAPTFSNGNFEFRTPMPMGKLEIPDFKNLPQLKDLPELKELPSDGTPRVFKFPGGEGDTFNDSLSPLLTRGLAHFGK